MDHLNSDTPWQPGRSPRQYRLRDSPLVHVPCSATTSGVGSIARSTRANEPGSTSCLPRRGSRVTKTVTTGRDSPASQGLTASHCVTGNSSIFLTGPHGTARHSQLPKLDVAGSIPVARSNRRRGVAGHLQPRVRVGAAFVRAFTPNFAHASHGIPCRWARLGSSRDLATSRLEAGRHRRNGECSATVLQAESVINGQREGGPGGRCCRHGDGHRQQRDGPNGEGERLDAWDHGCLAAATPRSTHRAPS